MKHLYKVTVFTLSWFSTSLLLSWQLAEAQHTTFDEELESFISSIEDAFCKSTWETEQSEPAHDRGIAEGFDSNKTRLNYSLPVSPPEKPAVGCCNQCKRTLDCVQTDSCCAQMFSKLPNITTKLVCSQPQLRPPSDDYISSDTSYLMLRGCSESDEMKHDPYRRMCEHPEDFHSLDVKVPVTDINQDVTYINRYCAFCNGRTDRDIVYWRPEVICKNGSLLTAVNVVAEISRTDSCNLIYKEPSSAGDNVQVCHEYISSCNVTGHWADYDFVIEQACAAYTTSYNNAYKNVFCFICNTDRDLGYDQCDPHIHKEGLPGFAGSSLSFSALLRFRPKYDTYGGPVVTPSECTENQIYDAYKDMCRNITCYPPRTYQHGKCVSPFQTVSGVWFRFYIRLTPNETLNQDDIEAKSIIDSILRWMEYTAVPKNTVYIRLFLKPSVQSYGEQSTTDYYLVQVDINIPIGYNVDASFIENMFSLETTKLSVSDGKAFNPLFVAAELRKIDKPTSHYSTKGELDMLYFDSIQEEMLLQINDGTIGANGELSQLTQLPPLEVMIPSKVCPLVELSISEFKMKKFTWGFSIKYIEKRISKARYIEIPGRNRLNKTIFVCKSLFEEIVNASILKYPRRDKSGQSDVPQGMLSLVCTCLSTFCSLLTLTTYVLFKELRTHPGINNIMLTISLICAQILFQFGASQAENVTELGCKILGVLVHFSWLMTIMWMNVCSLHMFRVFNSLRQKTTGTSIVKTTFIYTGYCIFISTIPVAATIVASVTKYGEFGYGGNICYISHHDMVGFTFALPVGVIIFTNCCLFFSVIIMITKLPKLDGSSTKNRNFAKIYIKLSTLTGLTWLFGFVFAFTGIEALEYIFIVLNAGVGVFIFLAFVCNKRVLKLFALRLRPRKSKYDSTKLSSISFSAGRESSTRCNGEVQS